MAWRRGDVSSRRTDDPGCGVTAAGEAGVRLEGNRSPQPPLPPLSESTLTDVRAGQEVYSESPVSHSVPRLRRGPSVSVLPKYPGRQLSGAGRPGLTGGCHPSRVLIRTSPDVCYLCMIWREGLQSHSHNSAIFENIDLKFCNLSAIAI